MTKTPQWKDEDGYLVQEGPPAHMAPSPKEIEVCRMAGELVKMMTASENWRSSQREMTLRADEWQGVLIKMCELKKALEG